MSLQERLKEYINFKGISVQSFEKQAGLTNGAVSHMGDNTRMSTLDKISNSFPELNINWLRSGIGNMCGEKAEHALMEMRETNIHKSYNPNVGIPYYDVDFLGGFDLLGEDNTSTPQYMIDFKAFCNATCVCNISGDSMSPLISNGDMIILQRIEDPSFLVMGDVYALVTNNGLRTVKRLKKGSDAEHYTMIAENTAYDSQEIPVKVINAVFKVMGVIKKL